MTTKKYKVRKSDLQRLQALSMTLVSMAEAYNLSKPVRSVINDIADQSEYISMLHLLNKEIK